MQNDRFNEVIEATLDNAKRVLTRKSEGYSTEEDRLHNFRTGAALNGIPMEQVCWGMATKHIISIRDMVMSGETYDADIWDEKLGDAINYLALLKAITAEASTPSDESLADLREKLTGSRHPSEAPAEIHITHDGGTFPRNQNAYSIGIEAAAMTDRQRDIDSIKRVADKTK